MNFLLKAAAYVLRHDAYLFFALLALFIPLIGAMRFSALWPKCRTALAWVASGLAVALLAWFCWITFHYLVTPVFFEHVEPQIPEAAWYRMEGHPLYHGLAAVQIYNLPYGPATYLVQGWFNDWFGPSLLAGKIPGVLANVLMLAVLFGVFRRLASARVALLAVALAAAFILKADGNPINGRSDSLLCLFVALGLAAATSGWRLTPIILGVLLGVATNFKIHAALYFIPVAAVALQRGYTLKQAALAVGIAVAVFLAPFFLLANISLMDYLQFIKAIVGHGFSLFKLQQLLWCFTVVLMAGVGGWLMLRLEDRARAVAVLKANALVLGGFLLSFGLLVFPASKYGAGPHHLMPWLVTAPFLGLLLFQDGLAAAWLNPHRVRWTQVFLVAWMLACFAEAFLALARIKDNLAEHAAAGPRVVADLTQVLQSHDKDFTILMGVGGAEDGWLTAYRCLLIFDHMPIGLDWVALMDHKRASLPAPRLASLVAAMKVEKPSSHGVLFLIPKANRPFSILTHYPPNDALFDQQFRDDFARQFKHTGSSEFFDFYTSDGGLSPTK